MSLPHYFLDTQILSHESQERIVLSLSPDDVKHVRVSRLAAGEHIAVVDASSDYFECEILSVDASGVAVRIAQKLDASQRRVSLTLIQGLAKGEKMELVIRHGTELGVDSFIPLACERSIVKLTDKKAQDRVVRWNSIAKSAAMQSGQSHAATVCDVQKLSELSSHLQEFDAVFVCWEEAPVSKSLKTAISSCAAIPHATGNQLRLAVIVGPEGGLSQREVEMLLSAGSHVQLVSLGSSILRTETAGIVAPALVLYEMGELGGSLEVRA